MYRMNRQTDNWVKCNTQYNFLLGWPHKLYKENTENAQISDLCAKVASDLGCLVSTRSASDKSNFISSLLISISCLLLTHKLLLLAVTGSQIRYITFSTMLSCHEKTVGLQYVGSTKTATIV